MQLERRCTHSKMPKAQHLTEHFHVLTTVHQLLSHTSQVLFSLWVELNDLDSGLEVRLHCFLKSASYSATFLHCSQPFQMPHVQRQFLFQLPWFRHWFCPLPPPIHTPSNLPLTYSSLIPQLARHQDWLPFPLKYPLPPSPQPHHSPNALFCLKAKPVQLPHF